MVPVVVGVTLEQCIIRGWSLWYLGVRGGCVLTSQSALCELHTSGVARTLAVRRTLSL